MRRLTWLGVVAVLGGVLVLGCFDAGDETPAGVGAFSDLLRFVPDEAAYRERVAITDYAAIREHYGLEALGGQEGWLAMQFALSGDDLGLPVLAGVLGAEDTEQLYEFLEQWELGFGFGFDDFDRALTAGRLPPRYLYAVNGRFDSDQIEETLAACSECLPHEVEKHAGQRYLSWGEGQRLRLRGSLPAVDTLGRGGVFVFTDEYVLRSNWTEDLTGMIDASQGRNSLEGREGVADVAEVADELGLFTLVLTAVTQNSAQAAELLEGWAGSDRGDRTIDAWVPDEGEVLLLPYSAWGAGSGTDDGGSFTAVILAHSSEGDAAENVGRLEERLATGSSVWRELAWSEMFTKVAVSSDGVVLTAKLYGAGSVEFLFVDGMDPLLLHE